MRCNAMHGRTAPGGGWGPVPPTKRGGRGGRKLDSPRNSGAISHSLAGRPVRCFAVKDTRLERRWTKCKAWREVPAFCDHFNLRGLHSSFVGTTLLRPPVTSTRWRRDPTPARHLYDRNTIV